LRAPFAGIDESGEDLLGRCMRTQDDKGENYGEEADNMEDQDEGFEFGQPAAHDSVDNDAEEDDPPVQHNALPRLGLVAWIR